MYAQGTARYDRAITVFSPDGHLYQVEYAVESVKKSSSAIGIRGLKCVVLAAEKKAYNPLQAERSTRRTFMLDNHVGLVYAGLNGDARFLIERARTECQTYKLAVEEPANVSHITRFIASWQHKYTNSLGRRPIGVAAIFGGVDQDGTPRIFQTDPSGNYCEWKANAIGRSAVSAIQYLENHYKEDQLVSEYSTVMLALRTMTEAALVDPLNIDVAVLTRDKPMKPLTQRTIQEYMKYMKAENQARGRSIAQRGHQSRLRRRSSSPRQGLTSRGNRNLSR